MAVSGCKPVPCYHPLEAWRGSPGNPAIVFDASKSIGARVQLPCGRCIGCRLERSRQWAVRCMHEASLHADNCFITLTYNEDNLPVSGSLSKREWQLFAKRMRKRCGPFRFFHCGEYGAELQRPHYHACIFGFDFPDKVLLPQSSAENRLFRSPILESLWPYGFSTIGAVTFESAAYVARYALKKVTGDAAEEHYMRVDAHGEVVQLQPEYVLMSRGGRTKGPGGIGAAWFRKFGNEVYPSDEVIARGFPSKPPRYYDEFLKAADLSAYENLKDSRAARARERAEDATAERLRVREACARARVALFKRALD